eukprot:jgi/Botrbrau1/4537/Bobra.60_2s0025.1
MGVNILIYKLVGFVYVAVSTAVCFKKRLIKLGHNQIRYVLPPVRCSFPSPSQFPSPSPYPSHYPSLPAVPASLPALCLSPPFCL